MQRVLITFFLWSLFGMANAETQKDSIKRSNIEYLQYQTNYYTDKIDHIVNGVDTSYIKPNKFKFTTMIENSNWLEYYYFKAKEAPNQKIHLVPNPKNKIGFYLGWKYIFVGWSFDIAELFQNKPSSTKRTEWAFSLYTSMLGGDIYWRQTGNDFKLQNMSDFSDTESNQIDGFTVDIKGVNAYWVFNHKKFSFPAAFSQSTNQVKSAGSLIAGASYSIHKFDFDPTLFPATVYNQLPTELKFRNLTYSDISLSVGYAYNWVFAKHYLASGALTPAIAYKDSKIDSEEVFQNRQKKLNADLISRIGMVYNNSKYYIGASAVVHTYTFQTNHFELNNSFLTFRIYAGFNFLLRK